MSSTGWLAVATGIAADAVALTRWVRVSQREHYIPSACAVTARRWIKARRLNGAISVAGLVAALVAAAIGVQEGGIGATLAAAVAGAVFPYPMTVLGRDVRLRV